MSLTKSRLLWGTTLFALGMIGLHSGCASSAKRKRAEDKSIPLAVEQSLKDLWLEKRCAELVQQQGLSDWTAQKQAEAEFREKYRFAQVSAQ